MVRELELQPPGGQLLWVPSVLNVQSSLPILNSMMSMVVPNVDVFGTERLANPGFAEVLGALGGVEVTHNAPLSQGINAPRIRIYVSMEYWHDDVVNRQLRAGRVLPESSGIFPFVALNDSVSVPGDTGAGGGDNRLAVRNVTVGPAMRIGVRADAMGAGARITLRVFFLEMQLGQYVRSIT
jgi:hypothetical protein